jgi:hypothetical protein
MKASCILIILRCVLNHEEDWQERNQPSRNYDIGRMCVCVCVLLNDASNGKFFDEWGVVKDLMA